MKELKEIQQRLNRIKEKLDLIEFENKDYEREKEDSKIKWICDNH